MTFITLLLLLIAGYFLVEKLIRIPHYDTETLTTHEWLHSVIMGAVMHGGIVLLFTKNIWLGLSEIILHAATDYLQAMGKISIRTQQFVNITIHCIWAILAWFFRYKTCFPW